MKSAFKLNSIRTRLLVAYMSIILVGLAGLTVTAGGQISSAAQVDFEQRMQNELRLIVQGVAPTVDDYNDGRVGEDVVNAAFAEYGSQVNGTLKLFAPDNQISLEPGQHDSFHNLLEMEAAVRGQFALVERKNESGEDTFYGAAQVNFSGKMQGIIQLAVPANSLQAIVNQRWLELGAVFALVTVLALVAALWLSRSIIEPLYKLRESAVQLSKGEFSHRVANIGKDEIGEVAQAFNEMAQQVESMLEEQRAFASNTSHELRTPLTTIRLRTEALRYDTTLDDTTATKYIEEIDEEVSRLGNLVQDLTLLSRFDAGRAELGKDQVDMLRFATSLQHQVAEQAKEKHIQIVLDLPPEPIPVNASINHLMVVFRNLLDNAIKYTPEGGEIVWKMVKAARGVDSTIQDTGRGIPPEHLPRLFERFYRVDRARSRDIPGTGLGLALAKSIVEAYGGEISIESDGAEKGTIARVYWPYQPTAPKSA
jgi:signal transduction histidine kinase